MQFSAEILDGLVAPNFTSVRHAEIGDLQETFPEAPHWPTNYLLNSAMGARFRRRYHQLVLAYLRRTSHCFSAYHDARRSTLEFLERPDAHEPRIAGYYAAVLHWETFVVQLAMTIELYNWMNPNLFGMAEKAFGKNDGSKEQRLYEMANRVKHPAKSVDAGHSSARDMLPLWFSEAGLESFDLSATYTEAGDVLADVSTIANALQNPNGLIPRRPKLARLPASQVTTLA